MRTFGHILLLIAFLFTPVFCNASTDSLLNQYLKKYNLNDKEVLFVVTINPAECGKYKFELTELSKRIDQNHLSKDVVYIIKGLRQKEIKYFYDTEMGFVSPESEIISDDAFYRILNPSTASSVTVLNKQKIIRTLTISQAVKTMQINKLSSHEISLVNSVILNEDKRLISNMTRIRVIDDSRALILDNTYNNLSLYNIESGKLLAALDPKYDYEGLYKTYINADPVKADFAKNGRTILSKYNMKEFSMDNFFVNGNNIYITCKLMYAEYAGGKDTFLTYYPFLLKTGLDLKRCSFVSIPDNGGLYIPLVQNAFWTKNDTDFVFTVEWNKKDSTYRYLAAMKYSVVDKKFIFEKMLNPSLPDYFVKNHIYYNFGPNNSFVLKNSVYTYFNWLIPYAYNTSDTSTLFLADNSLSAADIYTWTKGDLPLEIVTAAPLSNNEIAYVAVTEKGFFFRVVDAQSKLICNYSIPSKYTSGKMEIKKNYLYVLKPGDENVYLYKFKIE